MLRRQAAWRQAFARWKAAQGIPEGKKVFIMRGGYTFIRNALLQRGWCASLAFAATFCDVIFEHLL